MPRSSCTSNPGTYVGKAARSVTVGKGEHIKDKYAAFTPDALLRLTSWKVTLWARKARMTLPSSMASEAPMQDRVPKPKGR